MYLLSTFQIDGDCGREMKKRVQAGWNEWERVTRVICDTKGKVYKTVVRPTILYGLERCG